MEAHELREHDLTRTAARQRRVAAQIFFRHALCGKPFLELSAHFPAIKPGKSFDRLDSFGFVADDKAGNAVVDHLGH
jgi:hypothetical protein